MNLAAIGSKDLELVLNPKAMLFFISLFSSMIGPEQHLGFRIALCLWLLLATALWFSFVAYVLTQARIRQKFLSMGHYLDRGMGILLLALGAWMIYLGIREWIVFSV